MYGKEGGESLRKQLDYSRQSVKQIREKYIKGGTDFLRYLTILTSFQKLQRSFLKARINQIEYRIDLYRALGGSWTLERPNPETFETSGRVNDMSGDHTRQNEWKEEL